MAGRPSFVKIQLRRAGKLDIDIPDNKVCNKKFFLIISG